MIKGMTGFGHTQIVVRKIKILIEIKSVNHRYLDVNYFLPAGFGSFESDIRQILQRELNRGRVTVSIKVLQKDFAQAVFNKDVAKKHLKNISQLKKEFGIQGTLSLSDMVKLPGVLEVTEAVVSPEMLGPLLEKSFRKALHGVVQMRIREGRSLATDISGQLRRMQAQVKKIKAQSKSVLSEKKKILNAEEFRSFQRGSDVNEEITRLLHYIDEIKPLLKTDTAVGKKIDFVAQEMQRETNTIGAKLQDKIVSNAVIALKSKIEKIREQAQNVE